VVADAFVSVYETVVDDRGLIGRGSRLARLLRSLERRAYRCADKVIADTPQSAEYLRAEFGLEPRKVVALPLATDEGHYVPALYAPKGPPVRVLFVGTLIPLHGIDVISAAIAKLADREDIQFRVIGDGQEAAQLQAIAARGLRNLHWVREWRTSAEVAAEIRDADLCLGIFGAGRKTQRVCPLKLYAYAAVGRAIVTGDTRWYRQATAGLNYRPFDVVPVGRPGALVAKIVELAADPQRRMALAGDSRRFYEARLANRLALTSLLEVLFPEASASEEGR
jgi:glycosyltransferase involved in cell wall biosynthesis